MRYIPIDNSIQHGRAWRYMVGAVCISVYRLHGGRAARYTDSAGTAAGQGEARYTNATGGYTCVRYANTVYNRHHQSFATPGCVYRVRVRACACVILLYYYIIIILLYYYIIIFIYTQYIQYTQLYPTMVI